MDEVRYTFYNPLEDTAPSGIDILPLLKDMVNPVGIEIGVDEAPTSCYFLKGKPDLKLYGIDPYINYQDWYPEGYISQDAQNNKYTKMKELTAEFGDRWVHYPLTSDDAVSMFEDDSIDFIFIDGLHEYDQVLKDCRNYFPKIKKGGVFGGHDYKVIAAVGRAVDKFASEVGATPIYLPRKDAWYWIKE